MNANISAASGRSDHVAANGFRLQGPGQVIALPLDLVAVIIGYLDEPADLARCCRTSRILYYMTIPQLYHNVTLRSYAEIRHKNGDPEAMGGASPFLMGLNCLATRNVAGLVRNLTIKGEMKEHDVIEHVRAGRISDQTMLLNMALRSAINRTEKLQAFRWDFDGKPLEAVYQGLSNLRSLTTLCLSFPSSRTPRQQILIPPVPSVKYLKILNIDPLCYPDDVSLLLQKASNLERLVMHWSPRMREALEPSVRLHAYFGRCIDNGHVLPIRHLELFHLFTARDIDFPSLFNKDRVETVSLIKSIESSDSVFLDKSWDLDGYEESDLTGALKTMRTDNISKKNSHLFGRNSGLEKIYLVNSQGKSFLRRNLSPANSVRSGPSSSISTPVDGPSPKNILETSAGKEYVRPLLKNHGSTLRHLLLSDRWSLSAEDLAMLVRSCPNLTQLGMALELEVMQVTKMLLPFLSNLKVFRLLENPRDENTKEFFHNFPPESHMEVMSHELSAPESQKIRYMGVGQYVFEAGPNFPMDQVDEYGEIVYRRGIRQLDSEKVSHIAIWAMDTPEVLDD